MQQPARMRRARVLLYGDHHIGSFDDRIGLRALFKAELLDGFVGDR